MVDNLAIKDTPAWVLLIGLCTITTGALLKPEGESKKK